MATHILTAGEGQPRITVKLRSKTDGQGKTAVAYGSVTAYYFAITTDGDSTGPTDIGTSAHPASGTVNGDWTSATWVEIDATKHPGDYQFDLPIGVCAANVRECRISILVTDAFHASEVIIVTALDLQTASTPQTADCADIPTTTEWGNKSLDVNAKTVKVMDYTIADAGTGKVAVPDMQKVDVNAISGDTTAADNLELQFDGTGLTGGTFPATQAAVASVGSGTGAALNFSASSESSAAQILSAGYVGTPTGTYTNTYNDNGTYEVITHATNNIDWVWGFNVGAGRVATKAVFVGYFTASAPATSKTITVYAYNFVTPAWEAIKTITGQAGTTDITVDIALLSGHTGTGANAGKVYLEFKATGQAGGVLNMDQLYISAQNLGQTAGYADGSIWIGGSNTNTTPYVDGTADNPVTYAAALTLATATGLTRFRVRNGTTVTLSASAANKSFVGDNWILALGGQAIGGAYFKGATVSGTGTCATPAEFSECHIGAATTIGPAAFLHTGFSGTSGSPVTAGSAGQYLLIDCFSEVAGSGTPYFAFAGTGGTTGLNIRRWSGGTNITMDANVTTTLEVVTGGGQTVAVGGGNLEIRGITRAITLTTIASTSTVQIDAMTGPISLAGADGTVNVYGMCSALTDSRTGSPTLNNHAKTTNHAAQPATTYSAMTVTGAMTISDGVVITCSTGDKSGVSITGGSGNSFGMIINGTGNKSAFVAAASGTGNGIYAAGDGTGNGILATGGDGTISSGILATSSASSSPTSLYLGKDAVVVGGVAVSGEVAYGTFNPTAIKVNGVTQYWSTGDAFALIGTAGAGLTALGDTRIANLDAKVSEVGGGTPPTPDEIAAKILLTPANLLGTNKDNTVNAGVTLSAGDITDIADGVAAQLPDDWAKDLPGTYTSGQAGYIVGTNMDAKISSRSTLGAGAAMTLTSVYDTMKGLTVAATYSSVTEIMDSSAPVGTIQVGQLVIIYGTGNYPVRVTSVIEDGGGLLDFKFYPIPSTLATGAYNLLITPMLTSASQPGSDLNLTFRDVAHVVVPGVEFTITNVDTGQASTGVADFEGKCSLEVSNGEYTITPRPRTGVTWAVATVVVNEQTDAFVDGLTALTHLPADFGSSDIMYDGAGNIVGYAKEQ